MEETLDNMSVRLAGAVIGLLLIGCVAGCDGTTPARDAFAQDKMETRDTRIGKLVFEQGYPDHETLEKLYDERDFQRACQAYLWSLPAISMMDFIVSYQEDLGAEYGDLVHIKGYDDASHGITANATTEYMFGWHDLSLSYPLAPLKPCMQWST